MGVGTHLSSQQVDDLEGVLDNAHGHQLLAVVASVHHHGVGQTLHDGTLGLAEAFGSITPCRVRQVLGVFLLHSNVILQRTWGTYGASLQKQKQLLSTLEV